MTLTKNNFGIQPLPYIPANHIELKGIQSREKAAIIKICLNSVDLLSK
jgi:hypothetical protein